jgi:hypothetical protein
MTLNNVTLQAGRGAEKFLPLAPLDAELVQNGHSVTLHDGPVALSDVEAGVRRLHIQALIHGRAAERLYEEIEQQLPAPLLVCVLAFPVDAELRVALKPGQEVRRPPPRGRRSLRACGTARSGLQT